jgi:hypothetical protein
MRQYNRKHPGITKRYKDLPARFFCRKDFIITGIGLSETWFKIRSVIEILLNHLIDFKDYVTI